jgi:hypothetical protein
VKITPVPTLPPMFVTISVTQPAAHGDAAVFVVTSLPGATPCYMYATRGTAHHKTLNFPYPLGIDGGSGPTPFPNSGTWTVGPWQVTATCTSSPGGVTVTSSPVTVNIP